MTGVLRKWGILDTERDTQREDDIRRHSADANIDEDIGRDRGYAATNQRMSGISEVGRVK